MVRCNPFRCASGGRRWPRTGPWLWDCILLPPIPESEHFRGLSEQPLSQYRDRNRASEVEKPACRGDGNTVNSGCGKALHGALSADVSAEISKTHRTARAAELLPAGV